MFDILLTLAFVVAMLTLRNKAARIMLIEKLAVLLFSLLIIGYVSSKWYHLLFAAEGLVFAAMLSRPLSGCHILKLSVALLSFLHSFVAISYYLFSYEIYLTVYNLYPKIYILIVSLQIIGLFDDCSRQRISDYWSKCAAYFGRSNFFLLTTSFQRVKTK